MLYLELWIVFLCPYFCLAKAKQLPDFWPDALAIRTESRAVGRLEVGDYRAGLACFFFLPLAELHEVDEALFYFLDLLLVGLLI